MRDCDTADTGVVVAVYDDADIIVSVAVYDDADIVVSVAAYDDAAIVVAVAVYADAAIIVEVAVYDVAYTDYDADTDADVVVAREVAVSADADADVVVSNTTSYSDGTTHTKQHHSKRVQPNGSPCANNHCSTRYEQSFRHNKHRHTNQKAATDKHSMHNH